MATQVDYCNAALNKIAQDTPIASMGETSKAARAFNRCWPRVLDLVLSAHPWPFALTAVALAPDGDAAFPGWANRYALPEDCLNALVVCDANGVRVALQRAAWCGAAIMTDPGRMPFKVVGGTQQTCIVTDLDDAYLIYAQRVEDTGRFPPHVGEALACRLAMEVAPALAGELGLRMANVLTQNYEIALNRAIVQARNEAQRDPDPATPALAARY